MQTRNQAKVAQEKLRVRFLVKNEPSKIYMILRNRVVLRETQKAPTCEVRIPAETQEEDWSLIFDDAMKAWRANKNYLGNGCFAYKASTK